MSVDHDPVTGRNRGDILIHTPGGETGMTIINPTSRADIRFGDNALKLVAGTAGGVPTNGVAITTTGRAGIGTFTPATKLHVESSGITEMTVRALMSARSLRSIMVLVIPCATSGHSKVATVAYSQAGSASTTAMSVKAGLTIDGSMLVSVNALEILAGADFAENFDVSAEKKRSRLIGA
jgi:hypothetical protein